MQPLRHPIQNDPTYQQFSEICENLEKNPFDILIPRLDLAVMHLRFLWQNLEPKIAEMAKEFPPIDQHRVEHLDTICKLRNFSGTPHLESPGNYNTLHTFETFFKCDASALSPTLRPAMDDRRKLYLHDLHDLKSRIRDTITKKVSHAALLIKQGKTEMGIQETIHTANKVLADLKGTPEARLWKKILKLNGLCVT